MSLKWWPGGKAKRTPCSYLVYDHFTGLPKKPPQPLRNTNEKVHASVRVRLGLPGKGLEDKGNYSCAALDGWKVHGVQDSETKFRWQNEDGQKSMEEDLLSEIEWELLESISP